MTKTAHEWRGNLNPQRCWRLSNHKYILQNTRSKFLRDLEYLAPYYEHLINPDFAQTERPPSQAQFLDRRTRTFPFTSGDSKKSRSLSDPVWKLPIKDNEIKELSDWMTRLNRVADSLISALDEVTVMGYPLFAWAND